MKACHSWGIALIFAGLLCPAFAAVAAPLVITVGKNEDVTLNGAPVVDMDALSNAIAASGATEIYVRGNKNTRYQGVANVLNAARHVGVRELVLDVDGGGSTVPVAIVPSSDMPDSSSILNIDFDATVSWNGDILPDRKALLDGLHALARTQPGARIVIAPDALCGFAMVAQTISDAQQSGLKVRMMSDYDKIPPPPPAAFRTP